MWGLEEIREYLKNNLKPKSSEKRNIDKIIKKNKIV